jgi:hypothetical protein
MGAGASRASATATLDRAFMLLKEKDFGHAPSRDTNTARNAAAIAAARADHRSARGPAADAQCRRPRAFDPKHRAALDSDLADRLIMASKPPLEPPPLPGEPEPPPKPDPVAKIGPAAKIRRGAGPN